VVGLTKEQRFGRAVYPEHQPLLVKAREMDWSYWQLIKLAAGNLTGAWKIYLKEDREYNFFKCWYWCMDYDLTERYVWWHVLDGKD